MSKGNILFPCIIKVQMQLLIEAVSQDYTILQLFQYQTHNLYKTKAILEDSQMSKASELQICHH